MLGFGHVHYNQNDSNVSKSKGPFPVFALRKIPKKNLTAAYIIGKASVAPPA